MIFTREAARRNYCAPSVRDSLFLAASLSVREDGIYNQCLEKHVMAGLVPAIPAPAANAGGRGKGVDARHKAGHDDKGFL